MAALESDSYPDVPPPLQAELRDARTSGSGGEHHERKPPKIKVRSAPGKSLKIDMQPIDAVRLLSAFGTSEPGFASLMLSGIINAACDGSRAHLPPGPEDINDALAAVAGIGARDETEGMLATQMVATHFAAISALWRLRGSETVPQQGITLSQPFAGYRLLQCLQPSVSQPRAVVLVDALRHNVFYHSARFHASYNGVFRAPPGIGTGSRFGSGLRNAVSGA